MRTFVYVDGFNLYYGALKGTAIKWLDLVALFKTVLQPHHDILTVKYFTATAPVVGYREELTPIGNRLPRRGDVDHRQSTD